MRGCRPRAEEPEITFPPKIAQRLGRSPEVDGDRRQPALTFTARRNNMNSDIAEHRREHQRRWTSASRDREVQLDRVSSARSYCSTRRSRPRSSCCKPGLVRKPEVLVLQRPKANLEGEIGRITGDIGDAKERIARAVEQINGVRKTAIKTAVEQMHEVRGELADVRERMLGAKGVLDRVRDHRAGARRRGEAALSHPGRRGRGRQEHPGDRAAEGRTDHRGAVAAAGHRQRQARAEGDGAADRAEPAHHADGVRRRRSTCRPTRWRTKRSRSRSVRPTSMSSASGSTRGEPRRLPGFSPTPGMPAEVYIKTAERTFFEYIVRPIHDSMIARIPGALGKQPGR